MPAQRFFLGMMLALLAGIGFSQRQDEMVCTFHGSGIDPVYAIACRVGHTLLFEAPTAIAKCIIGDRENWLSAQKENHIWLQPKSPGLQTTLFVIVPPVLGSTTPRVFCFILQESSRSDGADGCDRVTIVTVGTAAN